MLNDSGTKILHYATIFFYSYFFNIHLCSNKHIKAFISQKIKKINRMSLKRNFICIIIPCMIGMIFSSCINDEKYPELYPTMGTVTSLDKCSINTDSYGIIIPKNPEILSMYDADSIGQRVIVNINFPDAESKSANNVNGKEVTIYEMYKVLTKKADDTRNENTEPIDGFGNDVIKIESVEISEEHLNIEFFIYGNDETIPHRISLLLTENTIIDDEGLLEVELKHNNNSDYGNNLYWGVVSFTLSSIPEYSDNNFKGFKIVYRGKENTMSELIVYKKSSDQASITGTMESPQKIGNRHSLLPGQLQ